MEKASVTAAIFIVPTILLILGSGYPVGKWNGLRFFGLDLPVLLTSCCCEAEA